MLPYQVVKLVQAKLIFRFAHAKLHADFGLSVHRVCIFYPT